MYKNIALLFFAINCAIVAVCSFEFRASKAGEPDIVGHTLIDIYQLFSEKKKLRFDAFPELEAELDIILEKFKEEQPILYEMGYSYDSHLPHSEEDAHTFVLYLGDWLRKVAEKYGYSLTFTFNDE